MGSAVVASGHFWQGFELVPGPGRTWTGLSPAERGARDRLSGPLADSPLADDEFPPVSGATLRHHLRCCVASLSKPAISTTTVATRNTSGAKAISVCVISAPSCLGERITNPPADSKRRGVKKRNSQSGCVNAIAPRSHLHRSKIGEFDRLTAITSDIWQL